MNLSDKVAITLLFLVSGIVLYGQDDNTESNASVDSIIPAGIQTGYAGKNGPSFVPTRIHMDGRIFTNELSVYEFLQGRMAGLDIEHPDGDAGKSGIARIRKQGMPLIVINGIPQYNIDEHVNFQNSLNEDLRSLIPVSMSDIESIEILKEGYATTLYGSEGTYGVILVETKKGNTQKKKLTYQFNQSFHMKPDYPEMLSGDEYVMYQLEAWQNRYGIFEVPTEIAYDLDNPDFYNYAANTDWVAAVTQPGHTSTHYLGFTGGNKANRVYGSVNYLTQEGTIINTGYDRFINRINFEHDFSKKLTAGIQISNSDSKHDENPVIKDESSYTTNILETAFLKMPNMSIWEIDASGNRTDNYFIPINTYQQYSYNPVAVSTIGKATNNVRNFNATSHLYYVTNSWLQIRESFSYSASSIKSDGLVLAYCLPIVDLWNPAPLYSKADVKYSRYLNELQTSVQMPRKQESPHALESYFTWISKKTIMEFNKEKELPLSDDAITMNAAVISIQYNFMNRYFLTSNTRAEYCNSNNLGLWDNLYGFLAGWNYSSEFFMKGLDFLNNGNFYFGWSYSDSHPFINTLTWSNTQQLVKSTDIGTDIVLLNNRIHLSANWYHKKIESKYNDLDYLYAGSDDFGYSGLEVSSDLELIKTSSVKLGINFNIAYYKHKVGSLPENSMLLNKTILVQPSGSIFGLAYEGIYASGEDVVAKDENGNILLDENEEPLTMNYREYYNYGAGDVKYRDINFDGTIDKDDLVYLGSSFPKYTGGFGTTFRFRNLSLTCNFHYRAGYKIVNYAALNMESSDSKYNMSAAVLNRWRSIDHTGNYPRAYLDHPANALPSDRYVKPGDFVKLNYINLTYVVGSELCRKIHVEGLTFAASAQRLFTLTGYNGMDPEIDIDYSPYSKNQESIRTLPSKIITFSVQLAL